MSGLGKETINDFKIIVNNENMIVCPAPGLENGGKD